MRDLPHGWDWTTLGELTDRIEAGRSFGGPSRPATGEEWGIIRVSAMTWGEFRPGENKVVSAGTPIDPGHVIRNGDILLSRANTTDYVGAAVLVRGTPPNLLLSDKSLRIVPGPAVDREFLAHLLGSPRVRNQISQRATGTKDSMRNVSQSTLRSVEIMLPPRAEQRRIVERIDELLDAVGRGTAAAAPATCRAALLRDRHLAHLLDRFDPREVALGALLVRPLANGHSVPSQEGGFPVLRLTAIREGRIDLRERKGGAWSAADAARFLVQKGDFLVSRGNGSRSLVGRGGLVVREPGALAFPDTMIRVATNDQEVGSEYLRVIWDSDPVRRQIERLARTTAGIYKISQVDLRGIEIPLLPRADQDRFVAEADDLRRASAVVESSVERVVATASLLRRSLLADAFAGRLVPQDPADEPAYALLARIRTERAAAQPERARRGSSRRAKP